jgi:hypothetical protein
MGIAMQAYTDLGDQLGCMHPEGGRSSLPWRRAQHLGPCSGGPCPFPSHDLHCPGSCPCPDPSPAHHIYLSDRHSSLAHPLQHQKTILRPRANYAAPQVTWSNRMPPRGPCCRGSHAACLSLQGEIEQDEAGASQVFGRTVMGHGNSRLRRLALWRLCGALLAAPCGFRLVVGELKPVQLIRSHLTLRILLRLVIPVTSLAKCGLPSLLYRCLAGQAIINNSLKLLRCIGTF